MSNSASCRSAWHYSTCPGDHPHIPGAWHTWCHIHFPGELWPAWPPSGEEPFTNVQLNLPESFTPFPHALNTDLNTDTYPDSVLLKHLQDSLVNWLQNQSLNPFCLLKTWLKSNSYQQGYNINSHRWLLSDCQSSLGSGLKNQPQSQGTLSSSHLLLPSTQTTLGDFKSFPNTYVTPLWVFPCFLGVPERRACPCHQPDTNSASLTVLTVQDSLKGK